MPGSVVPFSPGEIIGQSMVTGLSNAFDPTKAANAEANRDISKETVKAVRVKVAMMAIDAVKEAEAVLKDTSTSTEGRSAIDRILKGLAPGTP